MIQAIFVLGFEFWFPGSKSNYLMSSLASSLAESLEKLSLASPPASTVDDKLLASPVAQQSVVSPLGTSFLLLSSTHIIESISAPSTLNFSDVCLHADTLIDGWITSDEVILADFEGENMGFGGELKLAQFMPTKCINNLLEINQSYPLPEPSKVGLLVNASCPAGRALIKRIMSSASLTKLIWGADGDLTSLRHQSDLGISSTNVIDVQLLFSNPGKRLGMARALDALKELKPALFASISLPEKEFDPTYYLASALNMESTTTPYTTSFVDYSMSDLHRIELLLLHLPATMQMRSVKEAMELTANDVELLESGTLGVLCTWLATEGEYYKRKFGQKKSEKATQFARAIKHAEIEFFGEQDEEKIAAAKVQFGELKTMLAEELARLGVVVPDDLGFAPRNEERIEAERRRNAERELLFQARGGGRGGGRGRGGRGGRGGREGRGGRGGRGLVFY